MAKKTREELAEIEYRALEEAMREMQALQEAEEPSGIPGAEAATAEPVAEPAPEKPKRTRKPRVKKRPLLRVRLLQRSRSAPGSPGRKQSFRTS